MFDENLSHLYNTANFPLMLSKYKQTKHSHNSQLNGTERNQLQNTNDRIVCLFEPLTQVLQVLKHHLQHKNNQKASRNCVFCFSHH